MTPDQYFGIGTIAGFAGASQQASAAKDMLDAQLRNQYHRANEARAYDFMKYRDHMNFQRHMSNTAVTRRMRDMKNAGINPILAGKFDASTPAGGGQGTGVGPVGTNQPMPNKAAAAMEAAATALSLKRTKAEIRKTNAEADRTEQHVNIQDLVEKVADRIKDLIVQSDSKPFSSLSTAVERSKEAKAIRKETGIEVTPHVEKRLKNKPRGRGALKQRNKKEE